MKQEWEKQNFCVRKYSKDTDEFLQKEMEFFKNNHPEVYKDILKDHK